MQPQTICKTVHQYNKYPISGQDMNRLLAIAKDCQKVKNYVFQRYSGIGSLEKLYPGYTIQNEMTKSGLREVLKLPSVYFYLSIFDALGAIKAQWTKLKSKILDLTGKNENFTAEEKHYIRFILSISNAFVAVLNQKPICSLSGDFCRQYETVAGQVDREKLNRYICRQVRKYKRNLSADTARGFALTEKAYRYGDGGIYIAAKEPRQRIYIPLTDTNQYHRQIHIKLYPEESRIELKVPVDVKVHRRDDYTNTVGIAMGINTLLTTDTGHCFGSDLGNLHHDYAQWVRMQTRRYHKNRAANPGRRKYHAMKGRYEERLHSYINQELNRFLQEEKPAVVYMVKLPGPQAQAKNKTRNKKANYSLTMWQRGYIRKRLIQKCAENDVDVIEVFGKDISRECSVCGCIGVREQGIYTCPVCGYRDAEKTNTARNVKKRGENSKGLQ